MTMTKHLYFAYGSNLNLQQMENRCPGAQAIGRVCLSGWEFRIEQRGHATIIPKAGGIAWGGLWGIDDDHLASLDRYEGVAGGYYDRVSLSIETDAGLQECLVYVAELGFNGTPRDAYVDAILEGATAFNLPPEYIDQIAEVMA